MKIYPDIFYLEIKDRLLNSFRISDNDDEGNNKNSREEQTTIQESYTKLNTKWIPKKSNMETKVRKKK